MNGEVNLLLKSRNPLQLLLIFNAVVLLICIFLGYGHFAEAHGLSVGNVVYITTAPEQQGAPISLDSVKVGMDEFSDYNISFIYSRGATVSYGERDVDVVLSYTDSTHFLLINHLFINGGGWYETHGTNNVIVLSEYAAQELFGDVEILHSRVEIDGYIFEVGGVIGQVDEGASNFALIPYNHHGNPIRHVSGIYIGGGDYCVMHRHTLALRFAYAVGLEPNDLRFIDLDQYAYNILTRVNLFVLLLGGLAIVFFVIRFFFALESQSPSPEMAKVVINGLLALAFVMLCYFVWQSTEPNLPIAFEPYAIRPFIDSLGNRHTFEGLSYLSINHQRLYDINRVSTFPLIIGLITFANLALFGFGSLYAKYKLQTKAKAEDTQTTILEYILGRIVQTIPAFIIMSFIIFFVMNLMRGGPTIREPLLTRYVMYMLGMLQGDFGISLGHGGIDRPIRPISEILVATIPPTAVLVAGSIIVAGISGSILGIIAALKHNTWVDHVIMVFTLFASSIPIFFLAVLLLLIHSGERLGWITEYASLGNWRTMVLPILSLAIPSIAFITRTTRTSMLEIMKSQHITAARGRGLSERKITLYAISNVRISIINITALQLVEMFMGTVIVEEVFGMAGLGQQLLWAINFRDQDLMMGIIIIFSIIFLSINLVVDVLSIILDPRVSKSIK